MTNRPPQTYGDMQHYQQQRDAILNPPGKGCGCPLFALICLSIGASVLRALWWLGGAL